MTEIVRGKGIFSDVERDFRNSLTGYVTVTEKSERYYVDASNGNDNNDGSESAPFKTLNAALRAVPTVVNHDIVIHIKSGSYELSPLRARTLNARLVLAGDDFEELEASQAAQAGSSATEVVAVAGLGTDTYRGKTIEILTGDAAGDRRTIRDHTDTTITPVEEFSSAVADGDTFRIVRPAAEIEVDTGDNSSVGDNLLSGYGSMAAMAERVPRNASSAAMHFVNLRFVRSPNAASPYINFVRSAVVLVGCEASNANGSVILKFSRSDFSIGFDTLIYYKTGVDLLGAEDLRSWQGWGLGDNDDVTTHSLFLSASNGRVYYVGRALIVEGRSNIRLAGGNLHGRESGSVASLTVVDSTLRAEGPGNAVAALITATGGRSAVEAEDAAHADLDLVKITAATGYGVLSKTRSLVKLEAGSELNVGDVGLRAESAAQIIFEDGLTVTASGNDTELDDGTSLAIGSYGSPGTATDSLVRGTGPNNGTAIIKI